ncbi:MAG: Rab family GTPase [Cyclobacteriaceae bacterium]
MTEVSKKIIILGQYGVGKSSLIRQFVHRKFSDKYLTTIGVHVQKKEVEIGSIQLAMIIWDLEGDTSVSKVRPSYLFGANGIIYVFDLSRTYTYADIEAEVGIVKQKFPDEPVKIVGNKKDLINQNDLKAIVQELPVACDFLTSAKTSENVDELFLQLGKNLIA